MTHDLLRDVIQALDGTVDKVVVCDLKKNTFYALIHLTAAASRSPSTRVRAMPSHSHCGPAPHLRRGTRPREGPHHRSHTRARTSTRSSRSGSRASTRTIWASTRCSTLSGNRPQNGIRGCKMRLARRLAHDRRHREPEGRGGQDHHGHQPGGRSCPPGRQTLLVDLDPQANSTMSFLDMRQVTRTVYDVIAESDGAARGRHPALQRCKNLSIAPARIALAKLEARLVGEIDAHFRLKDRLEAVRHKYESIVIDCPPTLGPADRERPGLRLAPADPHQSSYFALEGTDDLLETIEKVRGRANPGLQILGVVITMHDRRTSLARDIREQIQQVFGGKVFKTTISKSVRLEESPAYKESISRSPLSRWARADTTCSAKR